MNDEVEFCLDSANESMGKAMIHFDAELLKIRAGRANPQMLSGVMVDYYGSMTALPQVANVGTPDARTLTVQPWEKGMLAAINKAIINSNLGLTEERRVELVKRSKGESENCKVVIRSARKDANDEIKKLAKDGLAEDLAKDAEASIQKLTDTYITKVESVLKVKDAEIMKV